MVICPRCGSDLLFADGKIECKNKHTYEIDSNIPLLYIEDENPLKITDKVKLFYEENPFPNYDDTDNVGTLTKKASNGIFARLLQEQIAYQAKVLEVGCGTGQMTNFLATVNRRVIGVDMSVSSLKLGQSFKEKNSIDNALFYQMNIFKPIFKPETFDYIICNGVLHHTYNPYKGFQSILSLLKKGGFVVVGLYNKYGRKITDIRRSLFSVFGDSLDFLDPNMRGKSMNKTKKKTWFLDQYKNPNESEHTLTEVINWFRENKVEFISCIPKLDFWSSLNDKDRLFENNETPNTVNIGGNQLKQLVMGSREGGLFIVIGRKK